ncbi:MAG: pilQ [Firmicutes bacterium]|nr:pilQ [Bacillota bacterium]
MSLVLVRMVLGFLLTFCLCSTAAANTQPVNMTVVNGEVRDVLTALADIGNINLVVDDTVSGSITIQLRDVSLETALELVTKTKGLTYQRFNNIIIVGTPEQIGRTFGNVHIFKLKYINSDAARGIATAVLFSDKKRTMKPDLMSGNERQKSTEKGAIKSGNTNEQKQADFADADRLSIDYATNSLIFYGTETEVAAIQNLLDKIDIPYQQIVLEAEVVAINKEDAKNIGIEWNWETTPQWPDIEPEKVTALQNEQGGIVGYNVEPGKVTRQSRAGIIQYGRNPEGYPYEFYYQAKINALVSKGNAKVLAKPKITTIDGNKAQILIGERIPVLVDEVENGKTKTTIQYVDAGIKLIYTPRINADGQITAAVRTEVSSPTLVAEMKAYRITTREAETTVRLKDGETMVIGGLIGSQNSYSNKSVPFLKDLPILGALFKNTNTEKTDTEVMIFLTPRIVI